MHKKQKAYPKDCWNNIKNLRRIARKNTEQFVYNGKNYRATLVIGRKITLKNIQPGTLAENHSDPGLVDPEIFWINAKINVRYRCSENTQKIGILTEKSE